MFIATPADSPETARVYQSSADTHGFVMNLTRAWAWRPDVFEGFAALRAQLAAKSSLSKREQAVMVCATAAQRGDSYCSLAWGKALAAQAGAAAAAAVLADAPNDALSEREQALARWARKVVADPNGASAQDLDALRAAGLSEAEMFEATVFIAFRLAFSTVNDALGAEPDWQLAQSVPAEVRAAVVYGRVPAVAPSGPETARSASAA